MHTSKIVTKMATAENHNITTDILSVDFTLFKHLAPSLKIFPKWVILVMIISGCTWGHPVKTSDKVVESDLIGEFKYRNEYIVEFRANGKAIQKLGGKEIELTWSINNNEISMSDLIEVKNGKITNHGIQTYIISHDYRDYYYPFGSPDDFDNYEVWNKVK